MRFVMVRKPGFSLIELIVVVAILGTIAAIVIPRISQAGNDTEEIALRATLSNFRTVIDMYAAQHLGDFPGFHKNDGSHSGGGNADDFYAQLLECSSVIGETGTCTSPRIHGPYLKKVPSLNVGKNADEKANEVDFKTEVPLVEHEGNSKGWIYNPENGQIIANTKAFDSKGIPFTDY